MLNTPGAYGHPPFHRPKAEFLRKALIGRPGLLPSRRQCAPPSGGHSVLRPKAVYKRKRSPTTGVHAVSSGAYPMNAQPLIFSLRKTCPSDRRAWPPRRDASPSRRGSRSMFSSVSVTNSASMPLTPSSSPAPRYRTRRPRVSDHPPDRPRPSYRRCPRRPSPRRAATRPTPPR